MPSHTFNDRSVSVRLSQNPDLLFHASAFFLHRSGVFGEGAQTKIIRGPVFRGSAKTKRNFEIFSAEKFIAAITQHILDEGFQMVRYYGWYSNRARGDRPPFGKLRDCVKRETEIGAPDTAGVEVIDVSEYHRPPAGGERIIEPFLNDPFPDYDTEPVMA